ncbi:hypothetical protein M422DRAFT_32340 [Sphaerobolus stellatus SS14]|uniref:Unplaced genomic scaffold SPHSTscaffold_70, whole genome shotgun sequence n=1 Tax=Sphaerobolus stellatus (strain SS14) TaxID=990650 RepID=A0A0C9UAW9_SPHS4|nr:hypothetical protein M422DRAFT_32340 [Sphaerobolus stellatus SS14]
MSFTVNRVVTKLMRTSSESRDREIPSSKRWSYEEIKNIDRPNQKNVPAINKAKLLDPEDMAW